MYYLYYNYNLPYPPLQKCNFHISSDIAVIVSEDYVDTFNQYNGFVMITIEDSIVTSMIPDLEAWEAWKATQVEPESEPSLNEQIATLQAKNQQLNDEVNMLMLALLEEHERQEASTEELKQALAELKGG